MGWVALRGFIRDEGMYSWAIKLKEVITKSNIVKAILEVKKRRLVRKKVRKEKELIELPEQALSRQAERVINLYRYNKNIIESLSDEFGFTPYFIMQPNLFTKEKLSLFEKNTSSRMYPGQVKMRKKIYELARREFCGDNNFYDVSNCIDTDETIYFDDHHISIKGNKLIVNAILDRLEAEIIKKSKL